MEDSNLQESAGEDFSRESEEIIEEQPAWEIIEDGETEFGFDQEIDDDEHNMQDQSQKIDSHRESERFRLYRERKRQERTPEEQQAFLNAERERFRLYREKKRQERTVAEEEAFRNTERERFRKYREFQRINETPEQRQARLDASRERRRRFCERHPEAERERQRLYRERRRLERTMSKQDADDQSNIESIHVEEIPNLHGDHVRQEARLAADRERHRMYRLNQRANETQEQRQARLAIECERQRQYRERLRQEHVAEEEARLASDRERHRVYRENQRSTETAEQRMLRLEADRERQRRFRERQREHQDDQGLEARRKAERERQRRYRANRRVAETPEQREARRNADRERRKRYLTKKRQGLQHPGSNFIQTDQSQSTSVSWDESGPSGSAAIECLVKSEVIDPFFDTLGRSGVKNQHQSGYWISKPSISLEQQPSTSNSVNLLPSNTQNQNQDIAISSTAWMAIEVEESEESSEDD